MTIDKKVEEAVSAVSEKGWKEKKAAKLIENTTAELSRHLKLKLDQVLDGEATAEDVHALLKHWKDHSLDILLNVIDIVRKGL